MASLFYELLDEYASLNYEITIFDIHHNFMASLLVNYLKGMQIWKLSKPLLHTSHWYGFPFVWILWWVCKVELCVKKFYMPQPHMDAPLCEFVDVHIKFETWVNIFDYIHHACMTSSSSVFFAEHANLSYEKTFWHTSHLYGFSFGWILWCLFK